MHLLEVVDCCCIYVVSRAILQNAEFRLLHRTLSLALPFWGSNLDLTVLRDQAQAVGLSGFTTEPSLWPYLKKVYNCVIKTCFALGGKAPVA